MELYNVIWGLMQLGQTSLAHTHVFTLLEILKCVQMLMCSIKFMFYLKVLPSSYLL